MGKTYKDDKYKYKRKLKEKRFVSSKGRQKDKLRQELDE